MEKDRLRLLLVRDTIIDARQIIESNPVDFDLLKAVWLADLAVELMLLTIVTDCNLLERQDYRFEDLTRAVNNNSERSGIADLKVHLPNINELHKRRNRVHAGASFSETASRQSVNYAEAFVRTALTSVYGLELDDFSMLSFVKETEAKEYLKTAVKCLDEGNYTDGAFNTSVAFQLARDALSERISLWSERVVPQWSTGHIHTRIAGQNISSRMSLPPSELPTQVKQLAFVLELTRFGIVPGETLDFLETSVSLIRPIGKDDKWQSADAEFGFQAKTAWSYAEVQQQIRFVTEVLYRIQQKIK